MSSFFFGSGVLLSSFRGFSSEVLLPLGQVVVPWLIRPHFPSQEPSSPSVVAGGGVLGGAVFSNPLGQKVVLFLGYSLLLLEHFHDLLTILHLAGELDPP